jgi:DNA-binding MarR family transcriptional regulator
MDQPTKSTGQKLAEAMAQFHKAFIHFRRAEAHQNFAGCKPSEIGVLFMIIHSTGPEAREMKVSEISKRLHVTSPSVTQILKGLEANGLIERHVDLNDRRAVGIVLTEKGKHIARKAEENFFASAQGLAEYLGEEQSNQLADLLFKAFSYFNEKESSIYTSVEWR